jgi:TM2 domain-containing membrane protein YozV
VPDLPFCGNCGAEYTEGTRVCVNCGADLEAAPVAALAVSALHKDVRVASYLLAGLVGIFIFGAGHFYLRKIRRGVVFLVLGIVVKTALLLPLAFGLVAIVNLGLWIAQIYDAHALAKKYNAYVERTGKPPW